MTPKRGVECFRYEQVVLIKLSNPFFTNLNPFFIEC